MLTMKYNKELVRELFRAAGIKSAYEDYANNLGLIAIPSKGHKVYFWQGKIVSKIKFYNLLATYYQNNQD